MTTIEKLAIDIITDKTIDFYQLCIEIAKNHPEALVENCSKNCSKYRYVAECKRLVESGEKVEAIKMWRNYTGKTLLEAKNEIENL